MEEISMHMREMGGCIYMWSNKVRKCGKYVTFLVAPTIAVAYADIPHNAATIK